MMMMPMKMTTLMKTMPLVTCAETGTLSNALQ